LQLLTKWNVWISQKMTLKVRMFGEFVKARTEIRKFHRAVISRYEVGLYGIGATPELARRTRTTGVFEFRFGVNRSSLTESLGGYYRYHNGQHSAGKRHQALSLESW
jgi:hypothetical protein